MNKRVTVLMSTYNGAKYLKEQIDSILSQEGVDVSLEIRDDGSSDDTVKLLKQYVDGDCRVKLKTGENIGVIRSFFTLLEESADSEFYAFCDQDDYWEKDKLLTAVRCLETYDAEVPALYCSNLKVVDENLEFCRLSNSKSINTDNKYSALVDFYSVGCTEVFNHSAATLAKKNLSTDTLMHDSWLFILCSFFGKVVYDYTPHILYRQHGHNVIGSKKNKYEQLKESFCRIFDRSIQPRLQTATALINTCESILTVEERRKVRKIVDYKKNFLNRISLLFDYDIRSTRLISDIKYRLLIILGLI